MVQEFPYHLAGYSAKAALAKTNETKRNLKKRVNCTKVKKKEEINKLINAQFQSTCIFEMPSKGY